MSPSEAKAAIDAAYDAADAVMYSMDTIAGDCFDRVPFVVEMNKEPEQLLTDAAAELKSRADELTSDTERYARRGMYPVDARRRSCHCPCPAEWRTAASGARCKPGTG